MRKFGEKKKKIEKSFKLYELRKQIARLQPWMERNTGKAFILASIDSAFHVCEFMAVHSFYLLAVPTFVFDD